MRLAETFPTFTRLLSRWESQEAKSRLLRKWILFLVGGLTGYGAMRLGYFILGSVWQWDIFSLDYTPEWWHLPLLFLPATVVLIAGIVLVVIKRTRPFGWGILLASLVWGF